MKSSSDLFPVSLIRAEVIAEKFIEDTYLLKPNNSPDKSVQIALTRLGFYESAVKGNRTPIILVHGSFTNRGFWLSHKGKGLSVALLEQGFDPWMLELRGHGDSPVNEQYLSNTVEKYAQFDLPAVADFVLEQTGIKPVWAGHSLGGVTVATAFAGNYIDNTQASGIALFGAQVSKYPYTFKIPFVKPLTRLFLKLKKPILSSPLGPEQEPAGIALEFTKWAGWFSNWKGVNGIKYWDGVKKVELPVLAFGAKKDKSDPSKYCKKLADSFAGEVEFHRLAKENGFEQDYNHVNMIIGDPAESEVWPKLISWITSLNKETIND